MASFEDKIGWKRSRTRENKNYHSVPTTSVIQNSRKIAKNFKQLKKYHYGLISSQNRYEKAEKERK